MQNTSLSGPLFLSRTDRLNNRSFLKFNLPEECLLTGSSRRCQEKNYSIIHHLILRRPDFPFFNAVCLGWLQYFPSKEWRFCTKPATDSEANRPGIPIQIGHPFERWFFFKQTQLIDATIFSPVA
jgi:hypothetical protein